MPSEPVRSPDHGRREVSRILDQLRRGLEGEAWHGPPVREVLAGVGASAAMARPISGAHTIWEIVLHMIVWEDEVRRRLEGAAPRTLPAAEDWPPVAEATETAWRRTLDELERGHARLVDTVAALQDSQLDEPLGGDRGTMWSFYTTLHGLAQHTLYHAGQIALLKRAVG